MSIDKEILREIDLKSDHRRLKRGAVHIAVTLFVVLVLLSGFLGILQFSTFDLTKEGQEAEVYLRDLRNRLTYENNEVLLMLTNEVIATELEKQLDEELLPDTVKIKGMRYDHQSQMLYLNPTLYGFYFPIAVEIDMMSTDQALIVQPTTMTLGKYHWPLVGPLKTFMERKVVAAIMPIQFNYEMFDRHPIISISGLVEGEETFGLRMQIDRRQLQAYMDKLKSRINDDLVKAYLESGEAIKIQAATLVTQDTLLDEGQMRMLLEDLFANQELVKHIFLLTDELETELILSEFQNWFNFIDIQQIKSERNKLLTDIVKGYAALVGEAYQQYFENREMLIHRGNPFSIEDFETITVTKLIEKASIEVPFDLASQMQLAYDPIANQMAVAYVSDTGTVIVFDGQEEMILELELFKERYPRGDILEADEILNKSEWDEFSVIFRSHFEVEEVYIRYIKSDGEQAFAVVSPMNDYQNFWAIALERQEGQWVILDDDIYTLLQLNRRFPFFNLDLVTDELEKIIVYRLGEEEQALILEQMIEKGYIEASEGLTITYCSFDGQYIAFRLSNGKDYVYKVENMYLAILHTKETAITSWLDIPDIILLEDEPLE